MQMAEAEKVGPVPNGSEAAISAYWPLTMSAVR